jgi:hypothetical protein
MSINSPTPLADKASAVFVSTSGGSRESFQIFMMNNNGSTDPACFQFAIVN